MFTTSIVRRVWLSILILTAASCELGSPEDFESNEPELLAPASINEHCTSPSPGLCVSSCGQEPLANKPQCRFGQWTCSEGITPDQCPHYLGGCNVDAPCGFGYTCVKSMAHPVPADVGICRLGVVDRSAALESCSEFGMLDSGHLVRNRDQFKGSLVKFTGRIGVTMKCSKNACHSGDPCCKNCVANYMVELNDPMEPQTSMNVLVRTETLPCQGTNCSISCNPMTVGETYRVWGLLEDCKGQSQCTLLYMGACML